MNLTLRHAWKWAGVALIFFVLGPDPSPVIAESHCQVTLGRGWANGTGQGSIVMRNTGQPCVGAISSDPEAGIFVDTLRVVSQPRNGAVSINAPRFSYTPNPGYVGRDRFELNAEGRLRGGRRITLGGEVTVQVNP